MTDEQKKAITDVMQKKIDENKNIENYESLDGQK